MDNDPDVVSMRWYALDAEECATLIYHGYWGSRLSLLFSLGAGDEAMREVYQAVARWCWNTEFEDTIKRRMSKEVEHKVKSFGLA